MKLKPTDEQQAVIECKFDPTDIIRVLAMAGTGKTATLIMFAGFYPNSRILYISFGKAIQLEAVERFKGTSVVCKTSHSLAYAKFGSKYQTKLVPSLKLKTLATALSIKDWDTLKYIYQTVMNFIRSADPKIIAKHVPAEAKNLIAITKANLLDKGFDLDLDAPTEAAKGPGIVKQAESLWQRMCDVRDLEIGMLHDGYLKLWQLSNPKLPYDIILLDEFQDTNSTVADVFIKQDCVRVMVGDMHQRIFGFRQTANSLSGIKPNHEFYLTKSFRFGQRVGDLASLILKQFKGETHRVIGLNGDGLIQPVDKSKQFTIITRTNAMLFGKAAGLYRNNRLAFIGGVEKYRFSDILDTYYLWANMRNSIKDSYIRSFASFDEMEEYSKVTDDRELQSRSIIVKVYKDQIPRLIDDITRLAVTPDRADITLTNTHQVKGLE